MNARRDSPVYSTRNTQNYGFVIFEKRSGLFVAFFFDPDLARTHLARNPLHWRLERWSFEALPLGANLFEEADHP